MFLHDSSSRIFSNTIIDKWDQLPVDRGTCTSIYSFNNKLNRFIHERVYIGLSLQRLSLPYQILLDPVKMLQKRCGHFMRQLILCNKPHALMASYT